MAFCTYCGQEFRRNEHLERHLATCKETLLDSYTLYGNLLTPPARLQRQKVQVQHLPYLVRSGVGCIAHTW